MLHLENSVNFGDDGFEDIVIDIQDSDVQVDNILDLDNTPDLDPEHPAITVVLNEPSCSNRTAARIVPGQEQGLQTNVSPDPVTP